MIRPRSYNTTYFRPKQQCNAILVVVVCLSAIYKAVFLFVFQFYFADRCINNLRFIDLFTVYKIY